MGDEQQGEEGETNGMTEDDIKGRANNGLALGEIALSCYLNVYFLVALQCLMLWICEGKLHCEEGSCSL